MRDIRWREGIVGRADAGHGACRCERLDGFSAEDDPRCRSDYSQSHYITFDATTDAVEIKQRYILGNAIYNMTPMARFGANIALRDSEMRVHVNAQLLFQGRLRKGRVQWIMQRWLFQGILQLAQRSLMVMRATIGRGDLGG